MWGARAAAVPRWCRALRSSAALGGSRDLLKKMLRKKKKKFWYDSPALGSKMMYKPTKLASVMKDDHTKTRKEDNIRCRVLNGLIHKAVAEMMATCEVNQELYDLKLDICKVSLASNFSACRVYWNPAATMEKESYVESVLRKSAPRIRIGVGSAERRRNLDEVSLHCTSDGGLDVLCMAAGRNTMLHKWSGHYNKDLLTDSLGNSDR